MKLQVNSLRNDKDGVEMRDEIVMVHESDVFANVGQSDVAEQGGYDAHMLHDMTPTQSMTHAMGGDDVVAELDNNRCTSRVTETMCDIGHCKQPHAQTGTCECRRECGEDKLTLRGELNNKTNSNKHTHQQEQGEGIAVEEMCHVGRGKSFRSQPPGL